MQSITSHRPITTSQHTFEVAEILAAGILRARRRQMGGTGSFPKPNARGENR